MESAIEIWRDVPGLEGIYFVSNLGRVHSSYGGGRVLKPYPTKAEGGYMVVSLYVCGVRTPRLVHCLVMEAFVGPCPEGQEVLHEEPNRYDVRLSNLRYGTHQENVAMTVAADRHTIGSRNGLARLTEADIEPIRNDRRPLKEIAADYGVHFATISCVRLRKTWAHV